MKDQVPIPTPEYSERALHLRRLQELIDIYHVIGKEGESLAHRDPGAYSRKYGEQERKIRLEIREIREKIDMSKISNKEVQDNTELRSVQQLDKELVRILYPE